MEKVRLWCGQPSDRGRLKNRTDSRREFGSAARSVRVKVLLNCYTAATPQFIHGLIVIKNLLCYLDYIICSDAIWCMHDFPVCLFTPAFKGCQNPINGLCVTQAPPYMPPSSLAPCTNRPFEHRRKWTKRPRGNKQFLTNLFVHCRSARHISPPASVTGAVCVILPLHHSVWADIASRQRHRLTCHSCVWCSPSSTKLSTKCNKNISQREQYVVVFFVKSYGN